MKKLQAVSTTILLAGLAFSTGASAESWICEQGNLVREIKVERATEAAVTCSVVYDKASEGQSADVLWTANADGAYCDAKADGLAEKLNGFGWSCTAF